MLSREKFDLALVHTHYVGLGPVPYQRDRYESPIEQRLAWSISKLIDSQDVALCAQVLVPTLHGAYRVDLLLHSAKKNTVIECDGQEFQQDYLADCARSAALLESGFIDQVVRFEGDVLHHSPDAAAYSLTLQHPEAFSERALAVARSRAGSARNHTEAAHASGTTSTGSYPVYYDIESEIIDDTDSWDENDNYIPATFLPRQVVRGSVSAVSRLNSQNLRDPVVVMRGLQKEFGCASCAQLIEMYAAVVGQPRSNSWSA